MTSPAVALSPMGRAALAYATQLRWCVFPLRGKLPAIAGGRGCLDALNTPEVVRDWWLQMPDANIGIATGSRSGIVVIDLDGPEAEPLFASLFGQDAFVSPEVFTHRAGRSVRSVAGTAPWALLGLSTLLVLLLTANERLNARLELEPAA